MLKTVILAENPFEPETWESLEVENICEFLTTRFDAWPAEGRIYHNQVAECNDVTPTSQKGIKKLQDLDGTFYCIIYPAAPVAIVIAVVIAVATVAVTFLAHPKVTVPSVAARTRNQHQKSPNNELSERQNAPRVNGRIPDIFGKVRSTPDLLAVPYKIFENHQEVEYSYMCIGRGYYDIENVRDDTTSVFDIAGTSVEVYEPFTSPNSGDAAQLTIGTHIKEPLYSVFRSNSVNGQVLRAPNVAHVIGNNNIIFSAPNEIISIDHNLDFTNKFEAGDNLIIENKLEAGKVIRSGRYITKLLPAPALFTFSITYTDYITDPQKPVTLTVNFNLSGTYTILAVSNNTIVLSNPAAVNFHWARLADLSKYGVADSGPSSPVLSTFGSKWIGPFVLDYTNLDQVFVNFVASNGLYKDDGRTQVRIDVTVEIELTPIDANGNDTGPAEKFQTTIKGSSTLTSTRAKTIKANPTFTGRCKARMRRVTKTDAAYKGTIVDETKCRDLFSVEPVVKTEFGNVTTVQNVTYATTGALTVKERKLNMLATRKIPRRVSGSTFTTKLYPTSRADEIISAVCLDRFIGNRNVAEIDFDNIYDTISAIETYFGTESVVSFAYTFDNDNLSFEQTIASIAGVVFSIAYRRGNVIKLSFEKKTADSTLLFNHRNKLPNTETRTVNFGYDNDNDGVEFEYVSPKDDAVVTYYLPKNRTSVNPKKIESIGIRSKVQAHFHAWRIWNKIRYGNVSVEFDATQEADLLVLQDRILVADNTRPEIQDGEIVSQNGLVVNTSQPLTFKTGVTYVAFLQLTDGTIENIRVIAGSTKYEMVLAQAPRLPLALDPEFYALTTYVLAANTDVLPTAFLVGEKSPKDNFTSTIKAGKYDDRFYEHDMDFINNLIDQKF